MYTRFKIQIHPRIYKEKPSEIGGDFRKSEIKEQNKETLEEEFTRKDFINSMIDIVGSTTNRSNALEFLDALLKGTHSKETRLDLNTLKFHTISLFDPDGNKKENFLIRVNKIKEEFGIKTLENIPQAEKNAYNEFKNKNEIGKYKNDIFDYIMKHPRISDKTVDLGNSFLDKKRAELSKLGISAMNEYEAVLITAENIVKSDAFFDNTGSIKKVFGGEDTRLRMEIFRTVIRDKMNSAAELKMPQTIDGFTDEEIDNLSTNEKEALISNSPDKLYDYFIDGLRGLNKAGNLTKDIAYRYIIGLEGQVVPILNKLGDNHPLKKIYENKFAQIRALAGYDVLYDSWASMKGFFTGNSLEKFFTEAEKGKGKDGSIGLENGIFKFYTVNEMEEAIMKTGEISGSYDTAWDSYINGAKDNYHKLKGIFSKEGLVALALYLDNKGNKSTLIDKNPSFGEYLKINYLPKDYAIKKEKYSEKIEELTIQKDFPNLEKIIKEKGLRMPEQLPKTANGSIDGVKLIFAIIEGNPTPGNIEAVKTALDKDFEKIKSGAQQKKHETVESLGEFKGWNQALEYLDIKNPLEGGVIITGAIEGPLSFQQQEAIKKQLELQETKLLQNSETPENTKKLDTIKRLLVLVNANKTIVNTTVARSAIEQAATENIVSASGNKDAEEKMAKSTNTNARAVVEQKILDDFSKRNTEIIQNLSIKYNLPLNSTELANPQYLNRINSIIVELGTKKPLSEDDGVFLDFLQRTKEQISLNSQSVLASQELAKSYPEFRETFSNIQKANTELYNNLTPQKIEQYEHIARFIFPENPVTQMTKDLSNMPPGAEISLTKYYSNSDIGNGMSSSISIEDCSFTKTGGNSGTVNFPPSMGIPPMKGVPIKGIESFLSQADLFVKLGFRSLIPAIQDINTEVSKKSGKGTSSFDGTFDSYELRRTSTLLCEIIGIEPTGNETIPDITNKINRKYPSEGDIRKKLKEMEILTEEGDFRKYQFQEIVQNMDNKTT